MVDREKTDMSIETEMPTKPDHQSVIEPADNFEIQSTADTIDSRSPIDDHRPPSGEPMDTGDNREKAVSHSATSRKQDVQDAVPDNIQRRDNPSRMSKAADGTSNPDDSNVNITDTVNDSNEVTNAIPDDEQFETTSHFEKQLEDPETVDRTSVLSNKGETDEKTFNDDETPEHMEVAEDVSSDTLPEKLNGPTNTSDPEKMIDIDDENDNQTKQTVSQSDDANMDTSITNEREPTPHPTDTALDNDNLTSTHQDHNLENQSTSIEQINDTNANPQEGAFDNENANVSMNEGKNVDESTPNNDQPIENIPHDQKTADVLPNDQEVPDAPEINEPATSMITDEEGEKTSVNMSVHDENLLEADKVSYDDNQELLQKNDNVADQGNMPNNNVPQQSDGLSIDENIEDQTNNDTIQQPDATIVDENIDDVSDNEASQRQQQQQSNELSADETIEDRTNNDTVQQHGEVPIEENIENAPNDETSQQPNARSTDENNDGQTNIDAQQQQQQPDAVSIDENIEDVSSNEASQQPSGLSMDENREDGPNNDFPQQQQPDRQPVDGSIEDQTNNDAVHTLDALTAEEDIEDATSDKVQQQPDAAPIDESIVDVPNDDIPQQSDRASMNENIEDETSNDALQQPDVVSTDENIEEAMNDDALQHSNTMPVDEDIEDETNDVARKQTDAVPIDENIEDAISDGVLQQPDTIPIDENIEDETNEGVQEQSDVVSVDGSIDEETTDDALQQSDGLSINDDIEDEIDEDDLQQSDGTSVDDNIDDEIDDDSKHPPDTLPIDEINTSVQPQQEPNIPAANGNIVRETNDDFPEEANVLLVDDSSEDDLEQSEGMPANNGAAAALGRTTENVQSSFFTDDPGKIPNSDIITDVSILGDATVENPSVNDEVMETTSEVILEGPHATVPTDSDNDELPEADEKADIPPVDNQDGEESTLDIDDDDESDIFTDEETENMSIDKTKAPALNSTALSLKKDSSDILAPDNEQTREVVSQPDNGNVEATFTDDDSEFGSLDDDEELGDVSMDNDKIFNTSKKDSSILEHNKGRASKVVVPTPKLMVNDRKIVANKGEPLNGLSTDVVSKEKSNVSSNNVGDGSKARTMMNDQVSISSELEKDGLDADENDPSIMDNESVFKLLPNNKTMTSLSIDAEKLSLLGNNDLTLRDVVLNDERTGSVNDTRSVRDTLASSRQPSNVVSISQNIDSSDEFFTPKNRTQANVSPQNGMTKTTAQASNDQKEVDREKTNFLMDNEGTDDTTLQKNNDDAGWAVKPKQPTTQLSKSKTRTPVVTLDLVESLPLDTETSADLTADLNKSNESFTSDNKKKKFKGAAKRKSGTKDLLLPPLAKRISLGSNALPSSPVTLNKELRAMRSDERQKSNISTGSSRQGSAGSRSIPEHTVVDLSKVADVSATPQQSVVTNITDQNVPSSTKGGANVAPLTGSQGIKMSPNDAANSGFATIPNEPIRNTVQPSARAMSVSTGQGNAESFMTSESTENMTTDADKSEDNQAEESSSFLRRGTESGSVEESFDVTNDDESMDKIDTENEKISPRKNYVKRAPMTTSARRASRLGFINSAHVIQISSSKESHMRALPSEKFWRRNQRRVSTLPNAEEGQLGQM